MIPFRFFLISTPLSSNSDRGEVVALQPKQNTSDRKDLHYNDISLSLPLTRREENMDLVSMIANERKPIEIIILKYFETDSTVMGFHEYQNKWDPIIGEVLETQMELFTPVLWSGS